jgi:zona occludens toxin
MAIYLVTGTPGAGKTLRTLWVVENLRRQLDKSGTPRDVYYCGIADLNLPWIEFDDRKKWHDLPDKSIIVIDEAQKAFRPRASSLAVPDFVEALETHRHRGIDLYVITQHPAMLEQNLRRLVDTHEHLMRKFGSKWATVHLWKGVKDNCDKSRKDSIETEFRYPKEVFAWYKSAELHTHRLKIPFKIWLLVAIPFICVAAFYLASFKLANIGAAKPALPVASGYTSYGPVSSKSLQVTKTTLELLADSTPRFAGLPWSAPRYDGLTQAVRVPVIRGCWLIEPVRVDLPSGCQLDGGVKVYPPLAVIKEFIRGGGYFYDFEQTLQASTDGLRAGDRAAAAPRAGDLLNRPTQSPSDPVPTLSR